MSIANKVVFLVLAGGVVLLAAQEPVREFAMDCLWGLCSEIHNLLGIS